MTLEAIVEAVTEKFNNEWEPSSVKDISKKLGCSVRELNKVFKANCWMIPGLDNICRGRGFVEYAPSRTKIMDYV
ncbi:MAG: hypothetical protein HQM11_07850 [SAR324 cluster bacterium]|nr:hypothetical protein [SAR324 cluster bacterium]